MTESSFLRAKVISCRQWRSPEHPIESNDKIHLTLLLWNKTAKWVIWLQLHSVSSALLVDFTAWHPSLDHPSGLLGNGKLRVTFSYLRVEKEKITASMVSVLFQWKLRSVEAELKSVTSFGVEHHSAISITNRTLKWYFTFCRRRHSKTHKVSRRQQPAEKHDNLIQLTFPTK